MIDKIDFSKNKSLGAVFSETDVRDYTIEVAGAMNFPEEFELKMRPVKNQETVGSCVAHSLAEIIEYFNFTQENKTEKMSTGFIYGNRRNSDYKGSGMILRDAIKAVCTYGDVYHRVFEENVEVPKAIDLFEQKFDELKDKAKFARFSTYIRLYTPEQIKAALINNGPVAFAINWYSDIKVKNGIMNSSCDQTLSQGGHCMVIYGWNKDGWKIQNSWSTAWGNKGRAIMPYYFPIKESWGIVDNIVNDKVGQLIVKPFQGKIKQVFAKILNFFIRIFKRNKK